MFKNTDVMQFGKRRVIKINKKKQFSILKYRSNVRCKNQIKSINIMSNDQTSDKNLQNKKFQF